MVPLLLAAALASPQTGFAFGRVGGSIMPFTVTIATSGAVDRDGAAPGRAKHLTKQQLAVLNRVALETRFTRMPAVTACPNTLPDVAAQFIRVGGRTVRVHGNCLRGFNRLWAALAKTIR
jgi:hypothetical protein